MLNFIHIHINFTSVFRHLMLTNLLTRSDFDLCLFLDLLMEMELIEPKVMLMNDGPRYVCSRCGVKYKKGF